MAETKTGKSPKTGKGGGKKARSLGQGHPSQGSPERHQDDRQCPLTWPCHPVERGANSTLSNTNGSWRRMSHVISGEVFRLWTTNLSTDKEPNSRGGGLKILEAKKLQVERINEAKRACCLVPTVNDKLSYISCSRGEGWQKGKDWREKKKKAEAVSTGCLWFSSKSLVLSNKSVKVLQVINRCCSQERGKIKPIIKLICNWEIIHNVKLPTGI